MANHPRCISRSIACRVTCRLSAVIFAAALHVSPVQAEFSQRVWNPWPVATTRSIDTGREEAAALDRINLRRSQVGLPTVERNSLIDTAARGHSSYLARHNLTGHYQNQTQYAAGFTGGDPGSRITAAGYPWTSYSEVISFGPATGADAIDSLVEAIYHRFGVFSSRASDVGIGMVGTHPAYNNTLTADLATTLRPLPAQPANWIGVYPYAGQTDAPRDFFSDEESPDPVAGRNQVGYPVSLHVDANQTLTIDSFTLTNATGQTLSGSLLQAASDSHTPASVAAFVPTAVLDYGSTYTARFVGSAAGSRIDKTWQFITAALASIRFCPATPLAAPGSRFTIELSGGSGSFTNIGWTNSRVISVSFASSTQLSVTPLSAGTATITVTDTDNRQASVTVTVQAGAGTPTSDACTAQPEPTPEPTAITPARFTAQVSGTTAAQTIALQLTPASADVGQLQQIFVAAMAGTQLYFNDGSRWQSWSGDPTSTPAWATRVLTDTVSVPLVDRADIRSLCAIDLAIGYGTTLSTMLAAGRYAIVHRLCQVP